MKLFEDKMFKHSYSQGIQIKLDYYEVFIESSYITFRPKKHLFFIAEFENQWIPPSSIQCCREVITSVNYAKTKFAFKPYMYVKNPLVKTKPLTINSVT